MRKLLILATALFLAACRPVPDPQGSALNCEPIARLQRLAAMVVSSEPLREAIHEEFELPLARIKSNIDLGSNDPQAYIMSWTDEQKQEYTAHVDGQGIVRLDVGQINISGDQLLACLGQPTQYYAYAAWEENGPHHLLSLFFPDQGVMAQGSDHWQGAYTDPIPAIDGKFSINKLMLMKPQSVEAMTNTGWRGSGSQVFKECKAWPGAWEKIEFAYKSSSEQ